MEPALSLSTEQSPATHTQIADMRDVPYQQAIGSLMYVATSTQPDIAFTATTLLQFMRSLGRAHWEAAKRALHYLKATDNMELTLRGTNAGLEAFVNADWASQPHRHSMSGYVVMLNGGPIAWSARKQPLITLSTAEAEYIALTSVVRELLFLQLLLTELYEAPALPIPIQCDNQAAIALALTGKCHIPYIHASLPDFGIQIRSGLILRSASDPIYDKLPKFISYSFNVITAYSLIW
jgi:hypothetical protein